MTRTIYYTATTLDGYIADAHDGLDWLLSQENDPDGPMGYPAFIAGVRSMVMGATTYQWVLDHMAESGEAWSYDIPCWVLTHRSFSEGELSPVGVGGGGADVRFAAADDPAALRAVHAEMVSVADGGDVWVVGGGGLAADLAVEGLLDEIVVSIAPVTLGAGKPLLPRPIDLRLDELDRNGAFLCARYGVVGPRDA